MCFGDQVDSLQAEDRTSLTEAAGRVLPSFRLTWHSNDDALTWAVLSRSERFEETGSQLPRFTICRLHACLMMMVEVGAAERRFLTAASIEDAVATACGIVRAVLASRHGDAPATSGVHEAPLGLQ